MSTQTETKAFTIVAPKATRGKSIDVGIEVEKRNQKEASQKDDFEKKMKQIVNEITTLKTEAKEDSSNRFTDAMTRVTDLLKVNQLLRDENNAKEDTIRKKNIEMYQLREESEELRDRIELLETIIQADSSTFEKYVNSNLFSEAQRTKMGNYIGVDEGWAQIDSVYVELIELRKIVRKLEKRNKNLEKQNMENQYQMHFIGNNEPSRPIIKDYDGTSKKLNIPNQPKGLMK